MELAVPRIFIPDSLLDNKFSDSLSVINLLIQDDIAILCQKYPKIPKMTIHNRYLLIQFLHSIKDQIFLLFFSYCQVTFL